MNEDNKMTKNKEVNIPTFSPNKVIALKQIKKLFDVAESLEKVNAIRKAAYGYGH